MIYWHVNMDLITSTHRPASLVAPTASAQLLNIDLVRWILDSMSYEMGLMSRPAPRNLE